MKPRPPYADSVKELRAKVDEIRAANARRRNELFRSTVGVFGFVARIGGVAMKLGANHHPHRCVCQGNDAIPHKHYKDPPHSCARCIACSAYVPAQLEEEMV